MVGAGAPEALPLSFPNAGAISHRQGSQQASSRTIWRQLRNLSGNPIAQPQQPVAPVSLTEFAVGIPAPHIAGGGDAPTHQPALVVETTWIGQPSGPFEPQPETPQLTRLDSNRTAIPIDSQPCANQLWPLALLNIKLEALCTTLGAGENRRSGPPH